MSYQAMVGIIDDALRLVERVGRFPAMIAADRPLDDRKRRRWLRLREGYVGEINVLRQRIARLKAAGPLDAGAERLAAQAGSHLDDAMRIVFAAVPGPQSGPIVMPATRRLRPPAVAPRPSRPRGGPKGSSEALNEAVRTLDGEAEADDLSWNQIKSGARKALAAAQIVGRLWTGAQPPADDAAKIRDMSSFIESERRRKREGDVEPASGRKPASAGNGEGESGWAIAARRLKAMSSPTAPARNGAAPTRPSHAAAKAGPLAAAADAAQRALRHAVAPAFAAAIGQAAHPDLVMRYVRRNGAPAGLATLRRAYAAEAARHFATEFARTISAAPKGTSESLALGAVIATALAQAGRRYPLTPAAAVPAMSVAIHKALQPRLPTLARAAAAMAAGRRGAAPRSIQRTPTPAHEMAW